MDGNSKAPDQERDDSANKGMRTGKVEKQQRQEKRGKTKKEIKRLSTKEPDFGTKPPPVSLQRHLSWEPIPPYWLGALTAGEQD